MRERKGGSVTLRSLKMTQILVLVEFIESLLPIAAHELRAAPSLRGSRGACSAWSWGRGSSL